jgi:1-acyl-sn-glycerol-3-phosphate acyltransferase
VSEKQIDHRRPEDRLTIQALKAVNTLFGRVYHRLDILNACPIPRTGPAIVVCNHISGLDPLLLQSACSKRLITWMMASEYMDLPGLGWFFRTIGVIPVERSGKDSGPLRAALRALQQGRVLGIFPEGRISKTGELLPFQTGVGMIAAKSGATVFPAYQTGPHLGREVTAGVLIPTTARLAFGPPLKLPQPDRRHADPATSTRSVEIAMALLKKKVDNRRADRNS